MPVTTKLPDSVEATGDLVVTVQGFNGCTSFDNINMIARSNSKLELYVLGKTASPCSNVPGVAPFERTFVDKTTTPRTNPFEVWVNGAKVGTVAIK